MAGTLSVYSLPEIRAYVNHTIIGSNMKSVETDLEKAYINHFPGAVVG